MSSLMGEVDLLGLDEFGQNPGMRTVYGALIGAGVASVATVAAKNLTDPGTWANDNAEWVGLGAGLLTAGAMYAMPGTRHAAVWAAGTAALSLGVIAIAKKVLGGGSVLSGLGIPSAGPVPQVYGAGLGLPSIYAPAPVANIAPGYSGATNAGLAEASIGPVPQVYGTGLSGPQLGSQVPVSLLGNSLGAQQASLLGGPLTDGLSAMYGQTVFGEAR